MPRAAPVGSHHSASRECVRVRTAKVGHDGVRRVERPVAPHEILGHGGRTNKSACRADESDRVLSIVKRNNTLVVQVKVSCLVVDHIFSVGSRGND